MSLYEKVTVTFVVGWTLFMTPKGHRVIRSRRDLLYDPKGHGDRCGRFHQLYNPKGHGIIRGRRVYFMNQHVTVTFVVGLI